jgi:hypothetical protein
MPGLAPREGARQDPYQLSINASYSPGGLEHVRPALEQLARPLEVLGTIVGGFDLALVRCMGERLVDERPIFGPLIVEDRGEARAPAVRHVPAGIAGAGVELLDRAARRSAGRNAGRGRAARRRRSACAGPEDVDGLARQRHQVLGRGIRLPDLGQLHPRRGNAPRRIVAGEILELVPAAAAERGRSDGRQREESRCELVDERRGQRVDVGEQRRSCEISQMPAAAAGPGAG